MSSWSARCGACGRPRRPLPNASSSHHLAAHADRISRRLYLHIMARLSNEERDILHALIEEYGEAFLQEYINQKFAPVIIKLRRIGVHNADDWIDIESFTEWIISASQKSARPSTPAVPTSSMPLRSLSNMPVSSPASAFRTPIKSKTTPNYRAPSSSLPPSSPPGSTPPSSTVPYRLPSVPIYVSDPTPPPVSALLQEKRKRQPTTASDEVIIVEQPQSPRPKHKKKKKKDSNMIDITRQKRVRELVTIDHPPVYFDVPKNTEDRAYLLDLTEQRDEPAFLDDEGEPRSMAWIVLKHNHDAFATRKSKSRKCNVVALDTECHAIEFSCSGTYVCDRFDATTLQNYERFKAKEGEQNELFGMERDMSEHSTQSLAARASRNCTGIPTYRPFKSVKHNYDGKTGFVGCSGWRVGDQKGDHRFTPIPRQHNERIIQHLFAHNGQLDPNDVTENDKQECTRMQAPRNGGKVAATRPCKGRWSLASAQLGAPSTLRLTPRIAALSSSCITYRTITLRRRR
ncbi:hypothetical protein BD626DRAFT_513699 [Schizophyllum amplum]|uniref:Uncharacterized protein n=1 Tax=Schizophyllum amplum TaxID=97359 RepID=A0A550BZ63_9AGAR|nr:hypothetical protein BD626DRAFT_513699 [Auriculariopsis ampla]